MYHTSPQQTSVSDYDTISTTEAVVVELQPAGSSSNLNPQLHPTYVIIDGSLTMAWQLINKIVTSTDTLDCSPFRAFSAFMAPSPVSKCTKV